MTIESEKTDYIPIIARYSAEDAGNQMWWAPQGSRPQFHEVDSTPYWDPYLFVPRLFELREWVTRPSNPLLYFLFWKINTVRNLTKQLSTLIIGDGFRVKIWKDEEDERGQKIEWEEVTKDVNEWYSKIGGKGRSVDNYLIPWVLVDNVSCGRASFYKYIGEEGDDDDEIGQLMLKHIDPRSYVVVHQDFRDWRKLVQFPIIQDGIRENMTRKEFENWKPSISWSRIWHFSSPGLTKQLPPRDIPWNKQYYFDLFLKSPMYTIVEYCISKLQIELYHIKGVEKYSFPFVLVKVPRHSVRDMDDTKYQQKLKDAALVGAEMRAGDAFAAEGEEYDENGRILSKGWEFDTLDTKNALKDFTPDFRLIDEQIAVGMFMNIAQLSSSGVQGQQTHLATGSNLQSIVQQFGKTLRAEIKNVMFQITKDYVFMNYNVQLEDEQIEEQWSKIREGDIAAFFQIIFQAFTGQLITFDEARSLMGRIGIDLPEIDQEDTMPPMEEEGEESAQGGMDLSKIPPLPTSSKEESTKQEEKE